MKHTGNTVLVTGGGSGIGRGLAEASQKRGNTVIIAGRRADTLRQVVEANPGMHYLTLDIDRTESIGAFAREVEQRFPALNVLINNAGIMKPESVLNPADLAVAESIVTTNLLGPIRLTSALLPLLMKQPSAAVMNVSSGLAFVPLALTPTYCATKAAIHSYTQSLRYQLKSTSIEVLELVPPYVQTDLMDGAEDPRAMKLDEFIAEVMSLMQAGQADEICVERVEALRFAERNGTYDATFNGLNAALADRFVQAEEGKI